MEGVYFFKTSTPISFSEQMLCSCDNTENQGCDGGFMDEAFKWISENGLCTESSYPYVSGDGVVPDCESTCKVVSGLLGVSYTDVANSEASLAAAVAQQPVSVAVDAGDSWYLYESGIFTQTAGTELNHAVLAVGYGVSSAGKKYWKIKNSWGDTWGEGKLFHLAISATHTTRLVNKPTTFSSRSTPSWLHPHSEGHPSAGRPLRHDRGCELPHLELNDVSILFVSWLG